MVPNVSRCVETCVSAWDRTLSIVHNCNQALYGQDNDGCPVEETPGSQQSCLPRLTDAELHKNVLVFSYARAQKWPQWTAICIVDGIKEASRSPESDCLFVDFQRTAAEEFHPGSICHLWNAE